MLTTLVTIFDLIWLCAVLVLLWLIWRSSATHMRHMETTLIEVAMRSADAAKTASEAAKRLAEQLAPGGQP